MTPFSDITTTRPLAALVSDHDDVKLMQESRGWAIVSESLASERERLIVALTTHHDTPKEVLDFHRATLRAIDIMMRIPDQLTKAFKTDIEFAKAKEVEMNKVKEKINGSQ